MFDDDIDVLPPGIAKEPKRKAEVDPLDGGGAVARRLTRPAGQMRPLAPRAPQQVGSLRVRG